MNKTAAIVFSLWAFISGCATISVKQAQTISAETETITSGYTGPKKKVAVIDFENKTRYGARRLGTSASDILVTELGKTGKFILVEREKIGKIVEEQRLGLTGILDSNTAIEIGNLLGVNAIVTGSISQFGVKTTASDFVITASKQQVAEAVVDIRVIDVETGEIIYTDSGKGIAKKKAGSFLGMGTTAGYDETLEGESLRAAIVKFVTNIVVQINKKPWSCKIAEVDSTNIYLDAGQDSGLRLSTELSVYHLGKKIISPTTGMVIGQTEEDIATIKVKRYFGNNGSIAELITGELPSRGSICRLLK
ncbi:CsgG/HfaB family protein [bacterium]|nr:CsgG/HfaB family protein [bacterium]MBU3929497.1 CsgG/HfaB family protein [bacterium]